MRGSFGYEESFGAGPTSGRGGVRALSRQHVQQRLGLDMWGMRDGEGVEVGIVGLLEDMSSRYGMECTLSPPCVNVGAVLTGEMSC